MINSIQPINFKADNRRLVLLSEYKGPILKLTKKDKEQINLLEKQITEYELSLYKLGLCKNNATKNKNLFDFYCVKILDTHTTISYLRKKIKEIKSNRLKEQIKKCK